MIRRENIANNVDWTVVFIYLTLVFMGWINIYAAVYNEEHKSILDFSQRYGSQLLWIIAAFFIILILFMVDLKFYPFFAYFIYGFSLFMLMLVLVFGKEINGARAWLYIGKVSLQPSEFAKVATALAIAKYLSAYNVKVTNIRPLFSIIGLIALPVGLIALQPDAGSILVFLSFSIMLFREGLPGGFLLFGVTIALLLVLSLLMTKIYLVAGIVILGYLAFVIYTKQYKISTLGLLIFIGVGSIMWGTFALMHKKIEYYYIIAFAFGVSGLIFLVITFFRRIKFVAAFTLFMLGALIFSFSVDFVFHHALGKHQQQRMNILLGLESDPLGKGYNINQSKIAIGSGGLLGKGFLQGTQTKFNFVPEQSTDFIFCTVGEEWGFLGTTVVLGLFLFLLIKIVIIAERQRSVFSRVYGYCVASILFFHVAINVGMAIDVLPVIGIPLPFFSAGGSSLWSFTALLFILLRLDASRLELLK
jgi:rod shape determining protein RodA